jgi:Family of unknown function (DUF6510)
MVMTAIQASEAVGPLDGNAVAGAFSEIFAADLTAAILTCNQCNASADIGEIRVYGGAMGSILRCLHCDSVVMRFVQTAAGSTIDIRGAKRIVFRRAG